MQKHAICGLSLFVLHQAFAKVLRTARGRHITKTLLVMKLTIILLTAAILNVSARGYSQTISFSGKNASLQEVLHVIKRQTGFSVVYNTGLLNQANPVSLDVKNIPLKDFLQEVFSNQPLGYSIKNTTIVVFLKHADPASASPDRPADKSEGITKPQPFPITGKVVGKDGAFFTGATIYNKNSKKSTTTGTDGSFTMQANEGDVLAVSYVGYLGLAFRVSQSNGIISAVVVSTDRPGPNSEGDGVRTAKAISSVSYAPGSITITLVPSVVKLEEISIAYNGYQNIPKERATGSFEVITAKQLQHSASGNLLQRLEGITTSIVFNNTNSPNNSAADVRTSNPTTGFGISPQTYTGGYTLDNMTIRGKNTLSTNGSGNPLVVIDGIANPYDISLINPDDVVSITILKDAAAASIWGSRAANGVMVIKTRKGEFSRSPVMSFNSNLTISEKPDLYYLKQMSTSDYIDAEIYGFNQSQKSLPAPDIKNGYTGRLESPVAEILDSINKGTLSAAAGNAKIDAFRKIDIRKDQSKYLLRNAVSQNYNLNVSGGSKSVAYIVAAGYQKSLNNTVRSNSDRINLSYNMQLRPVRNLDLSTGVTYNVATKNGVGPLSLSLPFSGLSNLSPYYYPYSRLADDNGNALAIPFYRPGFAGALNAAYGNRILDYTYKPLDDLNESYSRNKTRNLNFNLNASYRLLSVLSAQLTYSYNFGSNRTEDYYSGQSIYMRDLINRYTDPVSFVRNIPLGGFYNPGRGTSHNQTVRGMVAYNQNWKSKHDVNAIIGAEIFDSKSTTDPAYGYYGYDASTLRFSNVTYNTYFNTLFDPNYGTTSPIPNTPGISFLGVRSRTLSQFFNAAYTYDRRYTLSGSVRKDGSSAFADKTNRTGTPFYSAGVSWEISNEKFYKAAWLPILKLRTTFGYNGNSNPGSTPYARITIPNYVDYRTSLPYATVDNLSNTLLRPERTAITNIGLDFGTRNSRFSGSLEYFLKITKDLLSFSPLDPTLGVNGQVYNVADLRGSGVDLHVRSTNLRLGSFTWESNFNFSYNDVKVTKNYVSKDIGAYSVVANSTYYYEGTRLSTLYAYQWAGLNPETGAARVVSGDKLDEAGYSILYSALKKMGSSVPLYYGNLSNTFSYGGLSLWANVLYKLGYWQRRPTNTLFLNGTQMSPYVPQQVAGEEYSFRWQKSGDERSTNVPSRDINRSQFNDYLYQYANINSYKADNIRLQELNISYSFKKNAKYIKNPRVYLMVPINLILWRANKSGLDPDVYDYPTPRAYGFGFSATF
jgi:TonB-linked SusC/RagA family outer membrane protein